MIVNKVTVKDFAKIRMGDMAMFTVPSFEKLQSARVMASTMGRRWKCRFRVKTDFDTNTIMIRREERV